MYPSPLITSPDLGNQPTPSQQFDGVYASLLATIILLQDITGVCSMYLVFSWTSFHPRSAGKRPQCAAPLKECGDNTSVDAFGHTAAEMI
jgi:hypothetical protein